MYITRIKYATFMKQLIYHITTFILTTTTLLFIAGCSTDNKTPSMIYYTTYDGNIITPIDNAFNAKIVSNTYENGIGIIKFDNAIDEIGEGAFISCERLISINIPNGVTTIGNSAFASCINLSEITIPNSVTKIGVYSFSCCKRLTNITLPNALNTIGEDAFHGCKNLISITIPDNVSYIGQRAFTGCSNLKEFKGKYATEDGKFLIYKNRLEAYTSNGETRCIVPEGVIYIGGHVFENRSDLIDIKIPDSVTGIGAWSFIGCNGLTSIIIPENVIAIESRAFEGCNNLRTIFCMSPIPPTCDDEWTLNNGKPSIYVQYECMQEYKKADYWKEHFIGYYTED